MRTHDLIADIALNILMFGFVLAISIYLISIAKQALYEVQRGRTMSDVLSFGELVMVLEIKHGLQPDPDVAPLLLQLIAGRTSGEQTNKAQQALAEAITHAAKKHPAETENANDPKNLCRAGWLNFCKLMDAVVELDKPGRKRRWPRDIHEWKKISGAAQSLTSQLLSET